MRKSLRRAFQTASHRVLHPMQAVNKKQSSHGLLLRDGKRFVIEDLFKLREYIRRINKIGHPIVDEPRLTQILEIEPVVLVDFDYALDRSFEARELVNVDEAPRVEIAMYQ